MKKKKTHFWFNDKIISFEEMKTEWVVSIFCIKDTAVNGLARSKLEQEFGYDVLFWIEKGLKN